MNTLKTSFLLFSLLLATTAAGQETAGVTIIQGATVITGSANRRPIRNATIVIEDGRIRDIGPRAEVRTPRGAQIVDAKGKWIIPGLIDARVHFSQSGDLYTRPDMIDLRKWRPYPEEVEWIQQRLPFTLERYVVSGITGVVDGGGPMWTFEVRDVAGRTKMAPRLAVAGPVISTYVPPVFDISDPPIITAGSPEQARELVRRQLDHMPDLIEISFMHGPSYNPQQQTEILVAAINESKSHGLRVAVDAADLDTAKVAVSAGADILVHSVTDRLIDTGFIDLLTNHNVLYMTSLFANDVVRRVLNQEVELSDIEQKLGDPEVIASWSDLTKIPPNEIPGGLQQQAAARRPVAFDNLMLLEASGIRIVGASNAGSIGALHGPALHREFELMAAAGMRPAEILVSATRNAAAVMGREKEVGTLEKGKFADLVILDADPLADIKNSRKIFKVMKAGEFLP